EGCIALVLQAREAAQAEVVGPAGSSFNSRTPGNYKGNARYAVEALVGGARHGRETRVREVDGLGSETADSVDQQAHPAGPAQLAERPQIVEPSGRRLVMYDRHVRELRTWFGAIQSSPNGVGIQRFHPGAYNSLVRNPVLRADLGHALAVDTILD